MQVARCRKQKVTNSLVKRGLRYCAMYIIIYYDTMSYLLTIEYRFSLAVHNIRSPFIWHPA